MILSEPVPASDRISSLRCGRSAGSEIPLAPQAGMPNRENLLQKLRSKINLLDLFTKTPVVNRFRENGPGESGFRAPRQS